MRRAPARHARANQATDAVKRLGVDLDVETAKECGRLAEQVSRGGVAEYAPMGRSKVTLSRARSNIATQYRPL